MPKMMLKELGVILRLNLLPLLLLALASLRP
jgi:hypothetical protein